jgi:hypothetical protein
MVIRLVSTEYMYRKRFITVKEIRQMPGGICLRAYHYEALSSGGPRAAGRNTLQILGVTD